MVVINSAYEWIKMSNYITNLVYIRHIITVRIVGREYLLCAAVLFINLFTCQGKQVTGIINVKATCHQLWHTTFSLTGLREKTTIEGSTCALDSSVVLRGPCDRTVTVEEVY